VARPFNVTARPLVLVTKAGQEKTYGAADPANYEYTSVTDGGTPVAASVISNLGMTIGRAAGENAGAYDYTVAVTNTNYTVTSDGVNKFTINPKSLTEASITVTVSADKDYTAVENKADVAIEDAGNLVATNVPATQYNVAYFTDALRTVAAAAVKDAGTYYLTITGTGNYTGTISTEQYVINKIDAVVTYAQVTKTYDATSNFDAAPTYFGIKEPDMPLFASVTHKAISNKNAGTHQNVITIDNADLVARSANYNYTIQPANLKINPAPITITPVDKVVKYGDAVPTLEYTVEGRQGTDAVADAIWTNGTGTNASKNIKLSTNYTKGSQPASTYKITIDVATAKDNYIISKKNQGKLTCEASDAAVTFFAYNTSKTYGDADPTVWGENPATKLVQGTHFMVTGLEKATDLKGTPVLVREEGENAGTYKITISGEDLVDAKKYSNVKFSDGTFTVKPADLTVKVNDQTLHTAASAAALGVDNTYGVAYTVAGLKGTDQFSDLGGSLAVTVTDGDAAVAGTYADKISFSITNTNYALTGTTTGKLILVNPATIILDDNKDVTFVADQAATDVTFSSRVLKGEQWNVLVLPFATTTKAVAQALDAATPTADGYAVVDAFDETADDGNVHFNIYVKDIPAHTPFLVYPAMDVNLNEVTFTSVVVKKTTDNVEIADLSGNKFVGTFKKATEITGNDQYYMSGGKFYFPGEKTATIKPLRAYLDMSSNTASARAILIEEPDGTITAIESISTEGIAMPANATEGLYNLNGVRVSKAQKGVYIKNGKKVVVK